MFITFYYIYSTIDVMYQQKSRDHVLSSLKWKIMCFTLQWEKNPCFLSIHINWEFSHLLAFMYIQYTVYNSLCTYTLKIDKPIVKNLRWLFHYCYILIKSIIRYITDLPSLYMIIWWRKLIQLRFVYDLLSEGGGWGGYKTPWRVLSFPERYGYCLAGKLH